MGKTYVFDCPKCGYRAKVSGGVADGLGRVVQTIECCDCKTLYDVMLRVRVADAKARLRPTIWGLNPFKPPEVECNPFEFSATIDKLLLKGLSQSQWVNLKVRCPLSKLHRTRSWKEPGKCPRCGTYLERPLIPYRVWD